jgi:hypothetical protein
MINQKVVRVEMYAAAEMKNERKGTLLLDVII